MIKDIKRTTHILKFFLLTPLNLLIHYEDITLSVIFYKF